VVVVDKEGVVKLVPVPNEVQSVGVEYQLIVPPSLAVAPNVRVPVPHLEAGVEPVMEGTVLIVAVTAVLLGVVQLLSVAST
jgi:hypothetical protein